MSTPQVLAITLQLHRIMVQLGSVIQAFDNLAPTHLVEQVSIDPALQLEVVHAAPSAAKKLCAPVGADHTSAMVWRSHLWALRGELKTHFGEREFRLKELCSFLECRVDLLPRTHMSGPSSDAQRPWRSSARRCSSTGSAHRNTSHPPSPPRLPRLPGGWWRGWRLQSTPAIQEPFEVRPAPQPAKWRRGLILSGTKAAPQSFAGRPTDD
jgi:hypothetical protein